MARSKLTKLEWFARFFLVAWLGYFVFLLSGVNIIMSIHGYHPAYMVYYWQIIAGIIAGGILIIWKYTHPLVRLFGIGYFVFIGYTSARLLVDEVIMLAPFTFSFHVMLYAGLALSLLIFLGDLMNIVIKHQVHARFRGLKETLDPRRNRIALGIEAFAIGWLMLLPFSYGCFLQSVTITDRAANNLKVSFYHHPTGGFNYSWYVDPFTKTKADAEMTRYQQLNSTFYFGCSRTRFTDPQQRSNLTETIRYWGTWGLDAVPVIAPKVEVPPGSGTWKGDFSTYYNYQYDLDTIDLMMEWLEETKLSNVRGLSLDVEGPIYADERGEVINRTLWKMCWQAYQAKFDEFQQRFPGKITHLIAMSGIAKDFFDGDNDLDIAQKTCSVPPSWTTYGHMFYDVDNINTAYGWYMDVNHVIEEVGLQSTVPWIGWFGSSDLLDKNPAAWEKAKTEVKIGKSLGVSEVILAPVRNVRGTNHTVALQRLDELVAIRQDGFETFALPIRQNRRLYMDFPLYIEKIVPWYFIGDGNIFSDLIFGTPTGWCGWSQAAIFLVSFHLYWSYFYRRSQAGEPPKLGLKRRLVRKVGDLEQKVDALTGQVSGNRDLLEEILARSDKDQ